MASRYVAHVFPKPFRNAASRSNYYWYHRCFHIPHTFNFYCKLFIFLKFVQLLFLLHHYLLRWQHLSVCMSSSNYLELHYCYYYCHHQQQPIGVFKNISTTWGHVIRIWELSNSNLAGTQQRNWKLSWFFLVPSRQCWGRSVIQAIIVSFITISQSPAVLSANWKHSYRASKKQSYVYNAWRGHVA